MLSVWFDILEKLYGHRARQACFRLKSGVALFAADGGHDLAIAQAAASVAALSSNAATQIVSEQLGVDLTRTQSCTSSVFSLVAAQGSFSRCCGCFRLP